MRLQPTPLIIDENHQIIYSNSSRTGALIVEGKGIRIFCPGSLLLYQNKDIADHAEIKCISDEIFNYRGQELNFYDFRCQDIPKDVVRYTQRSCPEGGQEVEIGYPISSDDSQLLRQIKVCFDNGNLSPIYSHYNLTSNIGYRDSKVPRKFFQEDGFYSTSKALDNLYQRDNERTTINQLLYLDDNSDLYIKGYNDERFINRGHLTAKGDFVYAFQQLATFHYVNSAPQWASFNGGNWNELEISVRDLAHSTSSNLEVYTGVYGTTALKNSKDFQKTPLFLHTFKGKNLMPVPQLFWKIIYNRQTEQGIVVVGINNPHEINLNQDVICEDVSDRIRWFNNKMQRQKHNKDLGYIYACSVANFCELTPHCPQLYVQNLLL